MWQDRKRVVNCDVETCLACKLTSAWDRLGINLPQPQLQQVMLVENSLGLDTKQVFFLFFKVINEAI